MQNYARWSSSKSCRFLCLKKVPQCSPTLGLTLLLLVVVMENKVNMHMIRYLKIHKQTKTRYVQTGFGQIWAHIYCRCVCIFVSLEVLFQDPLTRDTLHWSDTLEQDWYLVAVTLPHGRSLFCADLCSLHLVSSLFFMCRSVFLGPCKVKLVHLWLLSDCSSHTTIVQESEGKWLKGSEGDCGTGRTWVPHMPDRTHGG